MSRNLTANRNLRKTDADDKRGHSLQHRQSGPRKDSKGHELRQEPWIIGDRDDLDGFTGGDVFQRPSNRSPLVSLSVTAVMSTPPPTHYEVTLF